MGNWISRDSYLDKHACSARNITWQYILNNGSLPNAYSDCLDSQAILYSHCCREGRCYPYFLDIEFERSKYDDWDGLGSPYMPGEKTSSYWSWFPCKIMWGEGEHHDHIIGVDGKYVKNESTYYPTNEVDIKGNDLRARGLMHSPDMRKHRLYTHDYHPTSHKSPGYHRKWLPQPISGPMKQEAITEDLPPWTEWTEQYQSQSNLPIKDGRVVAGVVLGLIVGISVIIVLGFYIWDKAQKNNWFSRLNNWFAQLNIWFSPVMPRSLRRRRMNIGPWDPRSEEEVVIEDGIETYRD